MRIEDIQDFHRYSNSAAHCGTKDRLVVLPHLWVLA